MRNEYIYLLGLSVVLLVGSIIGMIAAKRDRREREARERGSHA